VNLFLRVGAVRPDGYHDLLSVFQTVSLCDELHLLPRKEEIRVVCRPPEVPREENLCLLAARRLQAVAGVGPGVEIRLEKAIPSQAGLGGGSADAAATLLGLNRLWGLQLSRETLAEAALSVGSDVPYFLQGGAALVSGRGELVRPLAYAPGLEFVIARPPGGIATAEAYAQLDRLRQAAGRVACPGPGPLLLALAKGDRAEIARRLHNDFSQVVAQMNPDIMTLKEEMLASGCLGAEVCGSGSAVFGIAASAAQAAETSKRLAARWPWATAASSVGRGVQFFFSTDTEQADD
jgi:4-diphosphocytidyl-2-C-methyl-D-erythritol kinase